MEKQRFESTFLYYLHYEQEFCIFYKDNYVQVSENLFNYNNSIFKILTTNKLPFFVTKCIIKNLMQLF